MRIGDLNGDSAPDLLLVQGAYGTRAITCLTATTIAGQVLWQTGLPDRDNGVIYADLPAQTCEALAKPLVAWASRP